MKGSAADLVVTGGQVVTERGRRHCDIGIRNGVVVAMDLDVDGDARIDAGGLLVLPGGVDPHVHLTPMRDLPPGFPRRPDDFAIGSRAAAAGGITTIGNMAHQPMGEGLGAAIARDQAAAGELSMVDYFVHPVLNDPSPYVIDELGGLSTLGVHSVKVFQSFPAFRTRLAEFRAAMEAASRAGLVVLMHCEDGGEINRLTNELRDAGRTTVADYASARPIGTEVAAVRSAVALAAASGMRLYVVHLSSAEALRVCREARLRGVDVLVETRPLYLHFTEEALQRSDGARYLGNPPLRRGQDREALWRGLADAGVDTVASDHAPWTLDQKLDPDRDITSFLPGVADLETLRPLLYSRGVVTGRLPLERFVAVTSTNAARIFGLYPRKGTIEVGSDADLVLWDEEAVQVVDGSRMQSGAGYSVHDGERVRGWPVMTLCRGEVVYAEGEILGEPGRGEFVAAGAVDAG